jgi:hypothetical protein
MTQRHDPRQTTTARWKTAKGIPETATPHRVSLCETILSRKGRGNDTATATAKTQALSVSGLPRATTRPRNDDHCHDKQQLQKWKTTTTLIRNGDPSPCFALRNPPLPQGARERHDHDKSFISFYIAMVDEVHPRK